MLLISSSSGCNAYAVSIVAAASSSKPILWVIFESAAKNQATLALSSSFSTALFFISSRCFFMLR
ncbi:MAG: hypothetical protein AB1420_10930 [Bacillota bacterium]